MEKNLLNEDTEAYLKTFYEATLTENEFVSLLLPYMYRKGIRKITEEELSKKLFPYYLDSRYRILFTDIAKARYGEKVDITNGMYSEKYFSRNIMWTLNNQNILNLLYGNNYDTSHYEKDIKNEIVELLKSIADDFGIRNKAEMHGLNIYGYDPNKSYSLLEARSFGDYEFELITDGIIKSVSTHDIDSKIFYDDPSGHSECRTYKEGKYRGVAIKNASYAITQGTYNGEIRKIEVFTKILELEKLMKISEIASMIHKNKESLMINDKPYVRKLTL